MKKGKIIGIILTLILLTVSSVGCADDDDGVDNDEIPDTKIAVGLINRLDYDVQFGIYVDDEARGNKIVPGGHETTAFIEVPYANHKVEVVTIPSSSYNEVKFVQNGQKVIFEIS